MFKSLTDTAEYQTIIKCTPQLKTAVRDNLIELSGHLLANRLITVDQCDELNNEKNQKSERAAKLVTFVVNKVELNSGYYHTFIECLEEDEQNNRSILEHLKETYTHNHNSFLGGKLVIVFIFHCVNVRQD